MFSAGEWIHTSVMRINCSSGPYSLVSICVDTRSTCLEVKTVPDQQPVQTHDDLNSRALLPRPHPRRLLRLLHCCLVRRALHPGRALAGPRLSQRFPSLCFAAVRCGSGEVSRGGGLRDHGRRGGCRSQRRPSCWRRRRRTARKERELLSPPPSARADRHALPSVC